MRKRLVKSTEQEKGKRANLTEKVNAEINFHYDNYSPLFYSETRNTFYFRSPIKGKYIISSFKPLLKHELGFINRVKKEVSRNWDWYVIANEIKTETLESSVMFQKYNHDILSSGKKKQVQRLQFSGFRNGFYPCEIDVSSAYFTIAYNTGLISEETFEMAYTVSKKCRLASVGSLATTKKHVSVDQDGNVIDSETRKSEYRSAFFYLAKYLDDFMLSVFEKYRNDIFFYYVDAFFCKSSVADDIKKEIQEKGFKYSYDKYDLIEIYNGKCYISNMVNGELKLKKSFMLPSLENSIVKSLRNRRYSRNR